MPSDPTIKVRASVQNVYPGTETIQRVRHVAPEMDWSEGGHHSIVAEFTGTGTNTILTGSGPDISVNAVTQKNPITGVTLAPTNITGVYIYAGRAAAATAPTGTAYLAFVSAFMGATTSAPFGLTDGACFLYNKTRGIADTDGESLTVSLAGTTGYKISVVVFFEED